MPAQKTEKPTKADTSRQRHRVREELCGRVGRIVDVVSLAAFPSLSESSGRDETNGRGARSEKERRKRERRWRGSSVGDKYGEVDFIHPPGE